MSIKSFFFFSEINNVDNIKCDVCWWNRKIVPIDISTRKYIVRDKSIDLIVVISGQQHQQFRALGLGQRPFLDAPSSFTSHLRELESYRRNKHHHHHSSHLHGQQTGSNVTANSVSGACSNPNNTDPTASPASSTHLGATGGGSSSTAHQDCYKHSPQHGGKSYLFLSIN